MDATVSARAQRIFACLASVVAIGLGAAACSPGSLPGSPNPITVGGGGGRYDGTLTYRRLGGVFSINENAQSLSMSLQLAAEDQFTARFETAAGSRGTLQGVLSSGGTLTSSSFRATLLVSVPASSGSGSTTCEGQGDAVGSFSGTQVVWSTGAISYSNCAGLSTSQQATAAATSPIPTLSNAATVVVTVTPSATIARPSTCADGTTGYAFVVDFRETSGVPVDLDDQVTIEERRSNQTVITSTAENPVRTLAGGERRTFAACGHVPGTYQVFFTGRDSHNNVIRFASPVVTLGDFSVVTLGTVSGRVTNALNAQAISGARVAVANLAATTDSNGNYTIANVPGGSQTVTTSAPGFTTRTDTVIITAGTVTLSPSLVPAGSGSGLRVVLNWGAQPSDLDAHLTGPTTTGGRFHVSYLSPSPVPYASLDIDRIDGFGPETITVNAVNGAFVPGTYRYFVHNYSATPGFNVSSAIVTVIQGSSQVAQFQVANATGSPTAQYWSVFEVTLTASGQLSFSAVQQYTNTAPASIPLGASKK